MPRGYIIESQYIDFLLYILRYSPMTHTQTKTVFYNIYIYDMINSKKKKKEEEFNPRDSFKNLNIKLVNESIIDKQILTNSPLSERNFDLCRILGFKVDLHIFLP